MKRSPQYFSISDHNIFKIKMLNWANQFSIFCFLDNNCYHFEKPSFECILATGCARSITLRPGKAFEELKIFYDAGPSWLFGHFGYALKNETESLPEDGQPDIDFGPGFFFEPAIVIKLKEGQLSIISKYDDPVEIYESIECADEIITPSVTTNVSVKNSISRSQYKDTVKKLIDHIHRGDCYEINYCQYFFAEKAQVDPLNIYMMLTDFSPNPFAALYKINDKYCICASPERYLKKTGQVLISQPMKGTSKRLLDIIEDDESREYLLHSKKEKSENVMVVDLVRNDLSKVCLKGSVYVDELFGVYTFPQVHQMISTIKGKLKPGIHWTETIKATFPMGSMTGAPKKKVMELISRYESKPRGLFSGSIGYIDPSGDFDFNVVIRSIFYDKQTLDLSFHAGSGITFYSNPDDEFKECMLKAEAIIKVLKNS